MSASVPLLQKLSERFTDLIQEMTIALDEISVEISAEQLHEVGLALRDEANFKFELLVDLCVVD